MKSRTFPRFWKLYRELPPDVRRKARTAYRLWLTNPHASSLRFKRVSERSPFYSVRIGRSHRALGILEGDTIYWYFIGNHDEYERELQQM